MSMTIPWLFRRIALAALIPAVASAQDVAQPGVWAPARATIRKVMEDSGLPSVSVAVSQRGKIVWEEAFGWADRERMYKATPNTMYSLASISKPFTATGLMILVENGKVKLDRPANDYLGAGKLTGLAGDASAATVRRVLGHTAGLPLHYQFYYSDEPYPVVSNDETIARYGIIVNPPGEVFQYSNLGYGIIDEMISRMSGMDYADYMRTRVFAPLGLTRTSVGIGAGLEKYAAQRYDAKQRPIPFYLTDHHGASEIYASAHDLIRFGMFHLGDSLPGQRRILADSTLRLMHRAGADADYGLDWPPSFGKYGIGWLVVNREGLHIVSHSGGMPGVATQLAIYPDEDVAIVVLTNRYGDTGKIYDAVERVVLPRYTEVRRRWAAQDSAKVAQDSVKSAAGHFTPPAALVGEWTGTLRSWERTMPMTLVVKPDGDIHARIGDGLEAVVNEVRWRGNELIGRFAGTIPTSDASRWPHSVLLDVRLRSGTISGMATAQTTADPVHFALTSYVTLQRKVARR